MSRANEERWERWKAQNDIDCAKNFVVGAKVWRENYNEIQEGTVDKVSRCRYSGYHGDLQECADGDQPYYLAQFGGHNQFTGDFVSQTFEIRFFSRPEFARYELLHQLRNQIEDKQREIDRLQKLVTSTTEAGAVCVEAVGR